MKRWLYKIPGVRWADEFTDGCVGYWAGLVLGSVLWVLLLYVVADAVNAHQEVLYYRELLRGMGHP